MTPHVTRTPWRGPPSRCDQPSRGRPSVRWDRGALRDIAGPVGRRAFARPRLSSQSPDADSVMAAGPANGAPGLPRPLRQHGRRRTGRPGSVVGQVSDTTFTFEYSAYTRHVRGVYLPVTFTVGERSTHLILRVDCAATYGVLERPWAAYFGLTWEQGDPVHIGTAVGGFQAYLHVVRVQIDRFTWDTPVAIAEFESLPGAVARQVLGLVGFF